MIAPDFLRPVFSSAMRYDAYVATGSGDQQASWKKFHALVHLTPPQHELLGGFTRRMPVLVSSGTWCGDCVQQMPMLDHIARATNGMVDLRFVDRDEHKDLAEQVMICGGLRVPTVLFLNEDFEFAALAGDKSLSRLRARAAKSLGASCMLPRASIPTDEIAATLQDWVNDFERAQLLLRLSPKLRERHND